MRGKRGGGGRGSDMARIATAGYHSFCKVNLDCNSSVRMLAAMVFAQKTWFLLMQMLDTAEALCSENFVL